MFSLKIREDDYFNRMMGKVNEELSPFKDDDARDSVFMRDILEHYRVMEDFKTSTSDRQIERNDTSVHAYLKQMEVGEKHMDAKTLRKLQKNEIDKDNLKVKQYLTRRLQEIPKAM